MTLLLHLADFNETALGRRLRRGPARPSRSCLRGDDYDPDDDRLHLHLEAEARRVRRPAPTSRRCCRSAPASMRCCAIRAAQDVPIVRFIDDDLTQRMSDYVVAQVTHAPAALHALQARPGGAALGAALSGAGLGRDRRHHGARACSGSMRSSTSRCSATGCAAGAGRPKQIEGVEVLRRAERVRRVPRGHRHPRQPAAADAGDAGHPQLRDVPQAEARRLDRAGRWSINAARGGHQSEADIVRALDDGTLGAASLDVFEVEPLPQDSPLWAHGQCLHHPAHRRRLERADGGGVLLAR